MTYKQYQDYLKRTNGGYNHGFIVEDRIIKLWHVVLIALALIGGFILC